MQFRQLGLDGVHIIERIHARGAMIKVLDKPLRGVAREPFAKGESARSIARDTPPWREPSHRRVLDRISSRPRLPCLSPWVMPDTRWGVRS
jgi:hypothetical protein